MKQKKLRILALLLAIICMSTSFSTFAYAVGVTNVYAGSEMGYTAVTNTDIYHYFEFSGNYYAEGSSRNNLIIGADVRGAYDLDTFVTTLYMRFFGGVAQDVRDEVLLDTDTVGSAALNYIINLPSEPVMGAGTGYVEVKCENNTDVSDDYFYNDVHTWRDCQYGWDD